MLLGVMLFFDGALLALGNVCGLASLLTLNLTSNQILFVSGLTLIIGPQKTFYFFARKQKIRGTICFLGGIILVFLKWPFVGMVVETFGFLNLFGCVSTVLLFLASSSGLCSDFFPVIITFMRQLPFIGTALSLPYIRDVRSPRSGNMTLFSNTYNRLWIVSRAQGPLQYDARHMLIYNETDYQKSVSRKVT